MMEEKTAPRGASRGAGRQPDDRPPATDRET